MNLGSVSGGLGMSGMSGYSGSHHSQMAGGANAVSKNGTNDKFTVWRRSLFMKYT